MRTPFSKILFCSLLLVRSGRLRVQSTEQKSNEEEDQGEADAHKGQCLDYEIVLEFINEAIADVDAHRLRLIDRQQVHVHELCLGQHQLDITIFVSDVCGASCAVE